MNPTTPVALAPMDATAIKEDAHPGPQRHLDARLADAIREAKERTGLSWRGLAAATGISTPHLNHLSLGRRVPSRKVAETLIYTLRLDDEVAEGLRAVATPMWWERRGENP
jgi:ribosome-binding protein aMBF1 (putative translation factor)